MSIAISPSLVFAGRRGKDDRLTRTATIAVHDSSFIIFVPNGYTDLLPTEEGV